MADLTIKYNTSGFLGTKTETIANVTQLDIISTTLAPKAEITYISELNGRELLSGFYIDDVETIYNTNTGEVYYRKF